MSKHGQQTVQNALRIQPESAPVNDGLGELQHAYALYLQPDGRYVALHLEGVTAKKVEKISPNGAPESAPFATARCSNAMDRRTRQRQWGGK